METTSSRPRKIRTCRTCRADISYRGNSAIYCPPCRIKAYAFPTERPCKSPLCSDMVQRSGKVYPDFCSDACKPRCKYQDCDKPKRGPHWCPAHSAHIRRSGMAPQKLKWVLLERCRLCDGKMPDGRRSGEFCSQRCRVHWKSYGGNPPLLTHCIHCLGEIPLRERPGRRRQRADTKMCARCRQDLRKHGMSVVALAKRDGGTCGICGGEVDLKLRAPDQASPSVDHVYPRARGGTNNPENLQLAHLGCNVKKATQILGDLITA
jgi:hypothetical protein